eukprot:203073-Pelagomonas_calceolata.AAC.2
MAHKRVHAQTRGGRLWLQEAPNGGPAYHTAAAAVQNCAPNSYRPEGPSFLGSECVHGHGRCGEINKQLQLCTTVHLLVSPCMSIEHSGHPGPCHAQGAHVANHAPNNSISRFAASPPPKKAITSSSTRN